jgi:hypothetical protein
MKFNPQEFVDFIEERFPHTKLPQEYIKLMVIVFVLDKKLDGEDEAEISAAAHELMAALEDRLWDGQ